MEGLLVVVQVTVSVTSPICKLCVVVVAKSEDAVNRNLIISPFTTDTGLDTKFGVPEGLTAI